mmetsp:Transcript_20132/g.23202  ORF Transcript_20132/g.23202 Transcript_20132/m.23202 type:complete len:270 (-) Transcript_20132:817-1626(-)
MEQKLPRSPHIWSRCVHGHGTVSLSHIRLQPWHDGYRFKLPECRREHFVHHGILLNGFRGESNTHHGAIQSVQVAVGGGCDLRQISIHTPNTAVVMQHVPHPRFSIVLIVFGCKDAGLGVQVQNDHGIVADATEVRLHKLRSVRMIPIWRVEQPRLHHPNANGVCHSNGVVNRSGCRLEIVEGHTFGVHLIEGVAAVVVIGTENVDGDFSEQASQLNEQGIRRVQVPNVGLITRKIIPACRFGERRIGPQRHCDRRDVARKTRQYRFHT